jgi:hypothetical protein
MNFLGHVQRGRLNFYTKLFLLKGHVFAGFGMEPGRSVSKFAFQDLHLVRGFYEDFKFYVNNNHPFFVMINAHRLHPYSRGQRRAEFLAAFLTTFLGAGILLLIPTTNVWLKILFSVLICTIPTGMFLFELFSLTIR